MSICNLVVNSMFFRRCPTDLMFRATFSEPIMREFILLCSWILGTLSCVQKLLSRDTFFPSFSHVSFLFPLTIRLISLFILHFSRLSLKVFLLQDFFLLPIIKRKQQNKKKIPSLQKVFKEKTRTTGQKSLYQRIFSSGASSSSEGCSLQQSS